VRARSPHSMIIAASNSPSTSGAMRMSATPGNCRSGAGARSALTTATSLPRARSAYAMASWDPIESPSARACEGRTNRPRVRTASTIARICVSFIIVGHWRRGMDLVEQLLDAILAGDRVVVVEGELGRPLQAQPRPDLPAEEAGRAAER